MATYNGGRYSKFQQRLRNIVLNRLKKKTKKDVKQEEFIKGKVKEIKKEVLNSKVLTNNKNVLNRSMIAHYWVKDADLNIKTNDKKIESSDINKKNNKNNKMHKINVGKILKKDDEKKSIIDNKKRIKIVNEILKKEKIDEFGLEVVKKLKGSFLDKSAELDVLESELFLLSQITDNTLDLEKVKKVKKRINEMIEEVNAIIKEYNLYAMRYSLETFVGYDDKYLEDDIIKYRDMLGDAAGERKFVHEYKMLDEFISLYFRLDYIKHDMEEIQKDNEEKIEKYDIRDKKYDEIVLKVLKTDEIRKDFTREITEQNEYLDELMKKIDTINREEYITRHLAGLGNFLFNGLRFLGLKMLSPLSGLIPSITIETEMTRNLIRIAREKLQVEEVRHVYYSAVDFDSKLNDKLNDINYTENLIDDTLKDVKRLKEDFIKIYDVNVPGYEKTMDSINKMEELLYKNQCRVDIVKKKLKQSKKINENKMIKVKKLNENGS